MPRAAVIGLDGAAWHLIDPLIESGVMPRLAALKERGAWGTLRSTVPTYTPPAWTSAVTGVNPGRHGIFGFQYGNIQDQPVELMHAGKVKAAALWDIARAQGVRIGAYNIPLTYPPRRVDGWMVSGMMTPGFGERQRGFAHPDGLSERIDEWAPGYVIDLSANYETDWRDAELCRRALASIEQRYVVLERLLQEDPVDVVFSVMEAPDRLQHVYYRYLDPSDELYDSPAAKRIRPEIETCFAALDRVVGLLGDWAGDDGGAIVCSDHGFTAWLVTVRVNALLAEWGYLRTKPMARFMQTGLARALVPIAKRVLSRRFARQAKGQTFKGIDWSRTRAFASYVPQQGIHLNLKGRERFGIVEPSEADALLNDLIARFGAQRGPDGEPVTDVVHKRDDVLSGAELERAPDLFPVLRDHTYELDDEIFHRDPFTNVADLPRGVHHPDGIVIVAGPGVQAGKRIEGTVLDVTPTLLYQAGLAVPTGLDGDVLKSAFAGDHLGSNPIRWTDPPAQSGDGEQSPYSAEEEKQIEDSLRGLGYL
jgi:predicted AlkP superfamily phosphohydrolase/phosphomutase